jgi:hypothetical protein
MHEEREGNIQNVESEESLNKLVIIIIIESPIMLFLELYSNRNGLKTPPSIMCN